LAHHAKRSRFRALVSSEVVRGIVAEVAIVVVIGLYGGPVIVALAVAQAALAHLLVAAVNFIEHWGILRTGGKAGATHAWDAAAPLSHYALLGLSFHADHHARGAQPFDRLVLREASPKLPYGYFALVAAVLLRNAHLRRLLGAELSRRTPEVRQQHLRGAPEPLEKPEDRADRLLDSPIWAHEQPAIARPER
jgi:hypothetical protein